ncbi:MAG: helix-turn-helix domain-containing protein [Sciscionella sp.]
MEKSVPQAVTELGRDIGEYIRTQRSSAQISVRQLAKLAGVSNPYLSQVERGLRKPSAEILQQIAKGLRISAEALYVQAGILDAPLGGPVAEAIRAAAELSDRQKQVLLDVYESFRRENLASAQPEPAATDSTPPAPPQAKGTAGQETVKSTVDGSDVDSFRTVTSDPAQY